MSQLIYFPSPTVAVATSPAMPTRQCAASCGDSCRRSRLSAQVGGVRTSCRGYADSIGWRVWNDGIPSITETLMIAAAGLRSSEKIPNVAFIKQDSVRPVGFERATRSLEPFNAEQFVAVEMVKMGWPPLAAMDIAGFKHDPKFRCECECLSLLIWRSQHDEQDSRTSTGSR